MSHVSCLRFRAGGFTLVEVLLGGFILVVAMVALLGAFLGQQMLNANARNLTSAMTDATRVMEQVRQQNTGSIETCAAASPFPHVVPPVIPNSAPPKRYTSWDAWLAAADGGGGMSLAPAPAFYERIVVTCQNEGETEYCRQDMGADPNQGQVGSDEWKVVTSQSQPSHDPLRVTVAVCWRHRERTVGECTWNAGASTLAPCAAGCTPNTNARVIESPAMLTTLITCRQ